MGFFEEETVSVEIFVTPALVGGTISPTSNNGRTNTPTVCYGEPGPTLAVMSVFDLRLRINGSSRLIICTDITNITSATGIYLCPS